MAVIEVLYGVYTAKDMEKTADRDEYFPIRLINEEYDRL